ncbi:MAG: hypothetical protein AB1473_18340 [Thermodesulfobacteriota bacterium]
MNSSNDLTTLLVVREIPSLGYVELEFPTELPSLEIATEGSARPPRAPRKIKRREEKAVRAGEPQRIEKKAPAPEPAVAVAVPQPAPPIPPKKRAAVTRREPARQLVTEETKPAVREAPKPLKVVRRRGAEPPKVFRTEPRLVPEAMLVGVAPTEEESES